MKDLWLAEVAYKRALYSTEAARQHFSARMASLAEEYQGVEAARTMAIRKCFNECVGRWWWGGGARRQALK